MAEVLILDDDEQFRGMLAERVQRAGHGVSVAGSLEEGLARVSEGDYDVAFVDVRLPDGSGLDSLGDLCAGSLPPEIIIVTGYGDAESADLAIRYGAWDFIHKQSSVQAMMLSLSRALQYRESRRLSSRRLAFHADDIVGRSAAFKASMDLAAQAASSDANVLVTGETGTGKELFAAAIHDNSSRRDQSFVVVDCAALPESLIASVLFGHEKGAFTGADQRRQGLIEQADGGTLFLDEIGELPLDLQKAFLRVLQERRFRPIGADAERASNFRLIAATNKDLDQQAAQGGFRPDLLFRLRALTLCLPTLRGRREDIPLLTTHFVSRECGLRGSEMKGISEGFTEALGAYDWPGNVRELSHAVLAAITKAGADPVLFAKHLPMHIRIPVAQSGVPGQPPEDEAALSAGGRDGALGAFHNERACFEKAYLERLVALSGGEIRLACDISNLSRPHVYTLLKKHGLKLRA